ncbi:MAG: hypothetical protein JO040_15265 [Gemmatimonadetes bacterium]|nr:hypothetical protein [Gemmatimonadota bacterium]
MVLGSFFGCSEGPVAMLPQISPAVQKQAPFLGTGTRFGKEDFGCYVKVHNAGQKEPYAVKLPIREFAFATDGKQLAYTFHAHTSDGGKWWTASCVIPRTVKAVEITNLFFAQSPDAFLESSNIRFSEPVGSGPATQRFPGLRASQVMDDGDCSLVYSKELEMWTGECPGITGGGYDPPPPPPPLPPATPLPDPYMPGGGSTGGTGTTGGCSAEARTCDVPDPLCVAATAFAAWAATWASNATTAYNNIREAYIIKLAEYRAWDTQAKADDIYTYDEQMTLIRLGDELRKLEGPMKTAKEEADFATSVARGAALTASGVCLAL